jgi:uncharacterized repeat protein (TIGR01451 family)
LSITYDLPTLTPVIQPIIPSLPIHTSAARTVVSMGDDFDSDNDGIPNYSDNCPYTYNPSQTDTDGDGVGDACDYGSGGGGSGGGGAGGGSDDSDWDGVLDADDNCPYVFNPDQTDTDGDGVGDACEVGIDLTVEASPLTVQVGGAVVFTYTVRNTGELNLTGVTITDTFGNAINVGNLGSGATRVEVVRRNVYSTVNNDVTATGIDPYGGPVSDSDRVTITVVGAGLELTAEVTPRVITPGSWVTFTYTVRNVGDVELNSISVWDNLGTSVSYASLPMGSTVYWQVPYQVFATTTSYVTAAGETPQGSTVNDSKSVTVMVVEVLDPIVIAEPLIAGSTVVTGTAHPEQTVHIRDLMSSDFPLLSAVVQTDGSFAFMNLPPLVAGHVIVVEGYNRWDSAVVGGAAGTLAPIDIFVDPVKTSLCHGDEVVYGTAEPGQMVTLVITHTEYEGGATPLYQDMTTVDADGHFAFALGQPLQNEQVVRVSGYGESDVEVVQACMTGAYIAIVPQCGPVGPTGISIYGYNWKYQNANDDVTIEWDGVVKKVFNAARPGEQPTPEWYTTIPVAVTRGEHIVSAFNRKTSEVSAVFMSPCPSPNLVVTDLRLLTTEPISTYQPLNFAVTVANTGTRPVNSLFWVDLYDTDPTTRTTGLAWAALSGLNINSSAVLTMTLRSGFAATGTHAIWAMADSWYQVSELEEEDNTRGPITVSVTQEGTPPSTPPVTTTVGSLAGETWVSLTGVPVPHGRATVQVKQGETLIASTVSDDNARYEFTDLPVGVYTVIGETWINGIRYSNTYQVEIVEGETTVRFIIMYRG